MDIIEELYYGNLNPQSKCFDRRSEYGKFMKIISDNEEKLTAYLGAIPNAKEEQQLFSQMMNAQGEVLCISESERFTEGFRIGARFMLDTFLLESKSVFKDICEA